MRRAVVEEKAIVEPFQRVVIVGSTGLPTRTGHVAFIARDTTVSVRGAGAGVGASAHLDGAGEGVRATVTARDATGEVGVVRATAGAAGRAAFAEAVERRERGSWRTVEACARAAGI